MKKPWAFRSQLRPKSVPGLVRLGNPNEDGGYVVPEWIIATSETLLSLGLGMEWMFDDAVASRKPDINIIGVDHTIHPAGIRRRLRKVLFKAAIYRILGQPKKVLKYLEKAADTRRYFRLFTNPNVHVEKAVSAERSADTITIDELFLMVPSANPHSVMVSMDIEGSEYDVIADIARHHEAINMIVMEIHDVAERIDDFELAIATLQREFDIVHIHGNNYAPVDADLDIPIVLELTFVHRSLMQENGGYGPDTYPIENLDIPNCPGTADHPILFQSSTTND